MKTTILANATDVQCWTCATIDMSGMGGMAGGEWCKNIAGLEANKAGAEQTCSNSLCATNFMSKNIWLGYFSGTAIDTNYKILRFYEYVTCLCYTCFSQ